MRLRLTGAVLVLLGLVAAGTAVASATLWRPADHVQAEALASGATTMLVTDPGVLELVAGSVTVRATAPQGTRVVVAVGRESDVRAWVGTDPHTRVTGLADVATLATQPGEAVEVPVASPTPSPTSAASPGGPMVPDEGAEDETGDDASSEVADPSSSDMWVAQAEGLGSAEVSWTHRPGRWSLLVATTGADAGQPNLELTWPRDVVTPWFRPGLWLGCALVLAGAAVVVLGWRRSRTDAAEWVDVESEAGVEDVVPVVPVEVPAAPLTRRQLRELEAAQSSGRAARPVVPTVRRGGAPAVDVPSSDTPVVPAAPAVPVTPSTETAAPPVPVGAELADEVPPFVPSPPAAAEEAPYVPAFAPPRRGGVVPHIPSSPAARPQPVPPVAHWTPTAQGASAPPPAPPVWPTVAPPTTGAPEPVAAPEPTVPTTPAGSTAQAEPDLPAAPTPGRGAFVARRLLRRREQGVAGGPEVPPEAGTPAAPDALTTPPEGPDAATGAGASQTGTAPAGAAQTGTASADAWRARWGFVEMPPGESEGEQDGGER